MKAVVVVKSSSKCNSSSNGNKSSNITKSNGCCNMSGSYRKINPFDKRQIIVTCFMNIGKLYIFHIIDKTLNMSNFFFSRHVKQSIYNLAIIMPISKLFLYNYQ